MQLTRMTMNRILVFAAILLMAGAALAQVAPFGPAISSVCVANSSVMLTGTLRSANGMPAVNNVISLAPTNTGYISGCGVAIPAVVNCATSSDGSVVWLQNPLTTTTASAQYGSGTLTAGTYYVEYGFYDAVGHQTLASPEQAVQLTALGTLNINAPSSGLQSGAVGMNIYIGSTSGGESYQGQTVGTATFSQSTPLTSGAAVPSVNTTVCSVIANDAMWPVGTGYAVSLTDADGNAVPKFQQQWQLMGAGSTVNLSAGTPWYHGVVYYPSPILSAPTNHGQQGITGPLSLNGYNLVSLGKVGVGTALPAYALDVRGDFSFTGLFRINGAAGTTGQCFISQGAITPPTWLACGGTYYQTMWAAGTPVTQRPTLDFSTAFTLTDNPGGPSTRVDLAGQPGVTPGVYGVLTISQQGIVTSTASVATPNTLIVGSTLIEWGTSTGNNPTITFPIAYTTTIPVVTVSGAVPFGGSANFLNGVPTLTGFAAYTPSTPVNMTWISIGPQ